MRSRAGPTAEGPTARAWWIAAAGLAVTVTLGVIARSTSVGDPELEVVRWFGDWPDWPGRPLWAVMQLGSIIGAVAIGAVVAWACRGGRAAVAVAAAGVAAWLLARLAKAVVDRGRPADVATTVVTRFEPVVRGAGYPSGHAAVAFAVATVVSACVPGRWKAVPFVLATLVAVGRLYFGAHLLLDVVGGAGLGLAVGTAAVWAVRPRRDAS